MKDDPPFNCRRPREGEHCEVCGYDFDPSIDKVYVIYGTLTCGEECGLEAERRAEGEGRRIDDADNWEGPMSAEDALGAIPTLPFGSPCKACGKVVRMDQFITQIEVCHHNYRALMGGSWRKKPDAEGDGWTIVGGRWDGLRVEKGDDSAP